MKINYATKIKLLIFGLVCLVFVLAAANLIPHFRIRNIEFAMPQSAPHNQQITVSFNQQLADQDVNKLISIEPLADFLAIARGSKIIITFNQTLSFNTAYTVKLSPEIRNTQDHKLNSEQMITFNTRPAEFTYIERTTSGGEDKIIEMDLSGKKRELTKMKNISDFRRRGNNLVFSTINDSKTDKLYFVSLDTLKIKELQYTLPRYKILAMALNDQFAYISIHYQNPDQQNSYLNKVISYSLATDTFQELSLDSTNDNITLLELNQDGSQLLFNYGYIGPYHIFDLYSQTSTYIGRYAHSGGFADDNTLALIRDTTEPKSTLALFGDDNKEYELPTSFRDSVLLAGNKDWISYGVRSEPPFDIFQSYSSIVIENLNDRRTISIDEPEASEELAIFSPDSNYLLIILCKDSYLRDYQNQHSFMPIRADTIIYDLRERTIIKTVTNASNPAWNY